MRVGNHPNVRNWGQDELKCMACHRTWGKDEPEFDVPECIFKPEAKAEGVAEMFDDPEKEDREDD